MRLIEDTRQQKQKHEAKHSWWAEHDVWLTRSKLPYGDYALPPAKAVDTKADLAEITQNICGGRQEHQRFIDELKLARDHGCRLYVLVENRDGIEKIDDLNKITDTRSEYNPHKYSTRPLPGRQLARAMHTIEDRYGCKFVFCTPEAAAETILELLR